MKHSYTKWIGLILLIVCSIGSVLYMQQRYTRILEMGSEYQWPVRLAPSLALTPRDYLSIHYEQTTAPWVGAAPPVLGEPVYIVVGMQPSGLLFAKQAQSDRPVGEEYLIATATRYGDGRLDFSIPADRVRVNLQKLLPALSKGTYQGTMIATLKMSQGEVVVTGLYVRGVPIEQVTELPGEDADHELETKHVGNRTTHASGTF